MAFDIPIIPLLLLGGVAEAAILTATIAQHPADYSFNFIVLCCVAFNLALYFIYRVEIYPHFLSPLRHLPGPKGGLPLIGHGPSQFKPDLGADYLEFLSTVPNDGLIHFHGFFNVDQLLLTNPRAISEVLVTKPYNFIKPPKGRDFLSRLLGEGLVTTEGEVHKFQRKYSQPSFSFRSIKELYPIFWSKATGLTQKVTDDVFGGGAKSGVADLNDYASKVTLDVIGIAGLGRDFNTLIHSEDELAKTYEGIMGPSPSMAVLFAVQSLTTRWIARLLPMDWKLTRAANNLRSLCRDFVAEKRQIVKMGGAEKANVLTKLIESNNFSDEELVNQLLTFLTAGHETTSSTFLWCLYLLTQHPNIKSELRTEIHSAITTTPSLSGPPSSDLLDSLPLLNAVIQETLRFNPTVPLSIRVAIADTTILNHPIPKGTTIFLIPWAVNRSPHLWADADQFKPSRWIDEDPGTGIRRPNNTGGAESNYAQMTFLHGPRSCIGKGFALAELRCLLATFVGNFEFEMADPKEVVKRRGIVTQKPENGLRLRLRRVE